MIQPLPISPVPPRVTLPLLPHGAFNSLNLLSSFILYPVVFTDAGILPGMPSAFHRETLSHSSNITLNDSNYPRISYITAVSFKIL
jgi:hypothetical protein